MLRLFPTIQKLYWFDLDPNIFRETKEKLQPEFGDRVICRQNNWNIEIDAGIYNNIKNYSGTIALANGLQGFIISPIEMQN